LECRGGPRRARRPARPCSRTRSATRPGAHPPRRGWIPSGRRSHPSQRRTVVKGNLTRRGKTSWRFRFEVSANPRVTKSHTLRGTRKQAEQQAAKIIAEYGSGQYVDPNALTVADFAAKWLSTWAAMNHSNKTYERHEELLRLHVITKIGNVPIQKLKVLDLQSLYAGHAGAP